MGQIKRGLYLLIFLIILNTMLKANPIKPQRVPASKLDQQLYTQNIQQERNSQFAEIILIPPRVQNYNLNKLIFNDELSADFKKQYQERFQTQWQQSEITLQEMFTAYNSRVVHESQRRREFAEYIVKRLTEYHVDKYVQSDPSMKTIYEVKEKLQHVEVKVNKETKVNLNYSLSGNIMEVKFENPYLDESKIIYRMNPRSFGPTNPLLTEYRITKSLSHNKKFQLLYEEQIKIWGFFLLHNLSSRLNTFYGLNFSTLPNSQQIIDPITSQPLLRGLDPLRIQAGFGWSF
jgi:hypothetical protein